MNLSSRLLRVSAAALLAVCAGCRKPNPVSVIVGYDTSRSVQSQRSAFVALSARLPALLEPDVDSLALYTVDCDTREFYDKAPPASGEALQETLLTELEKPAPRDGTYPAAYFREAARRAEGAHAPVFIFCCTDGDNDDMTPASEASLRASARQLAKNARVRLVALYGISPANRAKLRSEFAPLGERLKIYGPDDTDLNCAAQNIEQARR